ncbi:hypothetical protein GMORB2_7511 [Geosmithia morbida]|uniref:Uncharacterized protein n=1 Tax=Geosmithia morbida TaxID=1094350 RepID=A0A9P4YWV9_9HYPO|nr:uncharacterized protein GMORB2_7511 [Geosmithia morbida]KAF4122519.1 hypothetical protein GMORB2_7511 [Geosmithia morbida]
MCNTSSGSGTVAAFLRRDWFPAGHSDNTSVEFDNSG